MSSPEQYTPRDFSALDVVQAAKRTADAILRANPLVNAVVSHGLMVWKGNHVDNVGDKTDYLWIGDFFPADPTMGGIPQKGFVIRRDDSTSSGVQEGTVVFAMYDHDPGGGGLGLRQTIHWESLDQRNLWSESRQGGQAWPEFPIPMGPWGDNVGRWPSTSSGSLTVMWDGWANIVGRDLVAEYAIQGASGAAGEYLVRVFPNGGSPIDGPLRTHGAGGGAVFKDTIDVSSVRGETRRVQLLGRVTNATGNTTASVISFRSYRP